MESRLNKLLEKFAKKYEAQDVEFLYDSDQKLWSIGGETKTGYLFNTDPRRALSRATAVIQAILYLEKVAY